MIANEYQYNLTKAQAAKFDRALKQLQTQSGSDNSIHPLLRTAEQNALQGQLETLKAGMAEYEALRSGKRKSFSAESLEELPGVLIKARIASGLTQKQLAEKLGLKEQQIQRYEATGYSSASLKRVNQVVHALGLKVREEVALR